MRADSVSMSKVKKKYNVCMFHGHCLCASMPLSQGGEPWFGLGDFANQGTEPTTCRSSVALKLEQSCQTLQHER